MWCSVVWCNPHSLCSVSHATRTGCDGHVQIDLPSLLCELVQQRNVTQGSVVASVHMHLLLLWTFTQCFGFEPHTKWLYLTSWIHIVTLFHLHEVEKPLHWFTESNWDVSHVGVLHNFFLYFILPHDSPPTPYWIHLFFVWLLPHFILSFFSLSFVIFTWLIFSNVNFLPMIHFYMIPLPMIHLSSWTFHKWLIYINFLVHLHV